MVEETFDTRTLDMTYGADQGAEGMAEALDRLCKRAEQAITSGYTIIVLSDRLVGPDRIPIPALLATAAVHHHLIRKGLRTSVGLVVETGEAREVHHFALLAGYGAEAINPYLAFETLNVLAADLPADVDGKEAVKRYIKSIDKGLMKVMSKMGISTYQSYCGAQIFDAIGLADDFVARYFTGTASRIGGIGWPRSRRNRHAGIRMLSATHRSIATRSMSVANTPTAFAARCIPGHRRASRCFSMRCVAILLRPISLMRRS